MYFLNIPLNKIEFYKGDTVKMNILYINSPHNLGTKGNTALT